MKGEQATLICPYWENKKKTFFENEIPVSIDQLQKWF